MLLFYYFIVQMESVREAMVSEDTSFLMQKLENLRKFDTAHDTAVVDMQDWSKD